MQHVGFIIKSELELSSDWFYACNYSF